MVHIYFSFLYYQVYNNLLNSLTVITTAATNVTVDEVLLLDIITARVIQMRCVQVKNTLGFINSHF